MRISNYMHDMKKLILIIGALIIVGAMVWFFEFKTEDMIEPVEVDPYAGNTVTSKQRAIEVAREHIENSDMYRIRSGRNLVFQEAVWTACDGCWDVVFSFERAKANDSVSYDKMKAVVKIHYWEIIDTSYELDLRALIRPEQCVMLKGRVLTISDGSTCDESEEDIGDVSGMEAPQVCCVKRVSDKKDDGVEYMTIKVGETFDIRVPSNPTTGHQWKVLFDNARLNLVESEYIEAEDKELVGASGEEVFSFEALKRGDTKVSLEYIRAFEPGTPPIIERAYAITVK